MNHRTPLAVALSFFIGSGAGAQSFRLVDLGTLRTDGTGESYAHGLNNAGWVVGEATTDAGVRHAFLWRPGTGMIDLGTLGQPTLASAAYAVNDAGTIAGAGPTQTGGFGSAYRWTLADGFENLGELAGGGDSFGGDISGTGVVVGWSNEHRGCGAATCMSNPGFAVSWAGTEPVKLGTVGGYFSVATGVNDAGETCGYGAPGPDATFHAMFIPAGGSPIDLGTYAGTGRSLGKGMNASGEVIGWSDIGDGTRRAMLWSGGVMTDLGALAAYPNTECHGVSDRGMIVGYARDGANTLTRAVLFRRLAPALDLNDLVVDAPGWTLEIATEVNDAGTICGYGRLGGDVRAFVLTPCLADADHDGFLTGDDFDEFVSMFLAGDGGADHVPDGFVNADDFDAYVADFLRGC